MELIGRDEINDLEAILSVCNTDATAIVHAVKANFDAVFTWDYERSRPPLVKLYEKAKTSQWNASTDLDWSIDVDPEKIAPELGGGGTERFQALQEAEDSPVKHFGEKEWRQVSDRDPELAALAVHARRAGRAALHRAHRRDRAVDRRQVLRRDAGDGRGPPRRGVRRATSTRSSASQYRINDNLKAHPRRDPRATPAGTSRTSACRSWSRASRSRRSA